MFPSDKKVKIFYEFKLAIHCEWSDWVLGECSQTCGTGTRTNTRTKLVKEEHEGNCTSQSTEMEACNTQECSG